MNKYGSVMKYESELTALPRLAGVYPLGIPVLVHGQFRSEGLDTDIGIVTECFDALGGDQVYYGLIRAMVCRGQKAFEITSTLEHYKHRVSACYWVHLADAEIMLKNFANTYDAKKIYARIELLLGSVRPNVQVCSNCNGLVENWGEPAILDPGGKVLCKGCVHYSADYQAFVESMVPHCHCSERNRPCDGVLAGSVCDRILDPEEPEDDQTLVYDDCEPDDL